MRYTDFCRMLRNFPASPAWVFTCSQHARHLLEVRTIMFWTSRFVSHCLVGPPSHLEEHLLEHLHPLLFDVRSHWIALALFTTFSNTSSLVRLPLGMLFCHGSLGPIPGCFSFFTAIWHVFHPPHPMTSMPLLPHGHGRRSIHGISSILTSQASGTHTALRKIEITIFHAQTECSLLCPCADLWHPHNVDDIGLPCRNLQHLTLTRQSFSRASQQLTSYRTHRLSDAFDIMSFLTEVDLSHLAQDKASCAIAKTRSSVPSAPSCTCDCSSVGRPRHQRRDTLRLLCHQIEIWTSIHGCRVNSSVVPTEIYTFIKHAPSPIINSVTRALVMSISAIFSTI